MFQWDDVPVFSPKNNDTAPFPPIFNPHHHLFFSDGYAYHPPPNSPFANGTTNRMAIFLVNAASDEELTASPFAAGQVVGGIGAGPRASSDAYWFDAFSASLGCMNAGPGDCTMRINGYVWDGDREVEMKATQQSVSLPPCVGLVNCHLQVVEFSGAFRALSKIQIEAFVNGDERRNFVMDDLKLGWWNNTCDAGLLRIRSRK